MGGGEVAQERMAVGQFKLAAGVLVGEHLPQIWDAGDLLGRVEQAKTLRVQPNLIKIRNRPDCLTCSLVCFSIISLR